MLRAVKYEMTAATRSTLRIEGRSILLDLAIREGAIEWRGSQNNDEGYYAYHGRCALLVLQQVCLSKWP